jgi:hypothetical protein
MQHWKKSLPKKLSPDHLLKKVSEKGGILGKGMLGK